MVGYSLCRFRKNIMKLKIEHKGLVDYEPCIKEMKQLVESQPNYHSCLLYTSPSPRDRTRSRMPSSA